MTIREVSEIAMRMRRGQGAVYTAEALDRICVGFDGAYYTDVMVLEMIEERLAAEEKLGAAQASV